MVAFRSAKAAIFRGAKGDNCFGGDAIRPCIGGRDFDIMRG